MGRKKGSILYVIVGAILILVILTGLVITISSVVSNINTNAEQTMAYRNRLLEDIKSELKNETQEAMSVCKIMNARYEAGEFTKEEAMKQAADIIRELKYNDGAGYFWVDTSKGINVVLLGRDTEGQSRWDSVDPNGTKFIQEMIKNGMQEGGGYTSLMFAKPNETEPLPKINYTTYYEPFDWVMGTGVWVDYIDELETEYRSAASTALKESTVRIALITLVIIAIGAAGAVFMGKKITKPIKDMNGVLTKMADGRFEMLSGYEKRNDEFGDMIGSMNVVTEKLTGIVSKIRETTGDINSSSAELSDMADQISHTAEDVSNAVQEIATGASQQADEIQSATENVGYIGDAVADVQNSSEELEILAAKMKNASQASSDALSALQKSSNGMTSKIDDISATISRTQDAVSDISEKVEGITNIASQTNLLSLNASIEAARAGEAGKGFAVVAMEIGKLAEDSKVMADEIKRQMEILLSEAEGAVKAAGEVRNANLEQQTSLGETIGAVDGMITDIDNTVAGVSKISKGAEVCDSSKNAVVDTMSALSAISEENAASSEETGASMQELSATVTTLASSADGLREIAEKLNKDMEFFK